VQAAHGEHRRLSDPGDDEASFRYNAGDPPPGLSTRRKTMFLGLRTVVVHVNDLAKAKAWYSEVLGIQPYFDQPFYVGFDVGGYELGLDPDPHSGAPGPGGVVAYWGVEDCKAAREHLIEKGATARGDVQDVGEGILVTSVEDPFGNVIGIIENPQFQAR
jgi:predicted enzyme related to lactoylglutathione lyase